MKKLKISIHGMHCSSCASNVEKSLRNTKGIRSVSVSILTNKAIIEADDNLNEEEINKAVSKAGYKVISIN